LAAAAPGSGGRLSFPFFFDPGFDSTMQTLEPLLGPGLQASAPSLFFSFFLSVASLSLVLRLEQVRATPVAFAFLGVRQVRAAARREAAAASGAAGRWDGKKVGVRGGLS
jgi:hypothetical protein